MLYGYHKLSRGIIKKVLSHLVPWPKAVENSLPVQQLDGPNPQTLCIQRLCSNRLRFAPHVGHKSLRRRVTQAEACACVGTSARGTAKVNERPALGARQPHNVSGLDVAVHVARTMQTLQAVRKV